MTPQQATSILENYNKWRRDTEEKGYPMPNPTELGIALEVVIKFMKSHS